MTFQETLELLKTSYSRQIFESYGYSDRRRKYRALETESHNNADAHPSMALHEKGGSYFLKDFAGEQKKYSSIDLIMINEGLNFADAVRRGAEICGIVIDDSKGEELPPDIKFIVSGLYAKAKREGFSVKEICSKHHYRYKDANGKKLYDKYRIDYILDGGKKEKHISQGVEKGGYIRKFKQGEYQSCIAMYGDFRQYQAGERLYIVEGEKCVDSCHEKQMKNVVTVGSANDWKYKGKKFAPFFKDTDVVILQDNDKAGENLTRDIMSSLDDVVASLKVIVPDRSREKADIADFFQNGGTLQQLAEMEEKTEPIQKQLSGGDNPKLNSRQDDVRELLSYKINYDRDGNEKSRKILQTVRNFEIAMENDARIAGKIKFDAFSQQAYLMGTVPWELSKNNYRAWSSFDDSALFSILQSDYGLTSRNDYFDALKNVAMRNKFHPVRDILDSLVWDGQEHIRNLLPDYLGVEDSDYQCEVMKLWMLGAVSRIYKPGCKFDYTMILQGKQGIGKSTFLQLLAMNDGWFNDSLDSLDSDKSAQSLMGSWIIELAELKSLARTAGGVDSVKRFLTATQDKYRVPYERRADIFLRQCVFAGTTNKNDFLQDETGNRRFLIIQTGVNEPTRNLFTPEATDEIKLAWAEAVHIAKTERPKLILPESCRETAEELQAESMADDGKTGIIAEYLSDKSRTCAIEIWQKALREQGRPQKWQASEINNIVLGLPGWKKMPSPAKFGEYGSQRGFQKDCSKSFLQCSMDKGDCSSQFVTVTEEQLADLPFD